MVSLQWYKEGKIDKIIEYCKQDVEITRDLFLYGESHGYVKYSTRSGVAKDLKVEWETSQPNKSCLAYGFMEFKSFSIISLVVIFSASALKFSMILCSSTCRLTCLTSSIVAATRLSIRARAFAPIRRY